MATFVRVEAWAVVDENGDYAVGETCEEAAVRYRAAVGEPDGRMGLHQVRIVATVPTPDTIVLKGDAVPEGPVLALRIAATG